MAALGNYYFSAGYHYLYASSFVVASLRTNLENKICLRTYPVRSQASSPITIIDAILATCATQPEFGPVSFGERYKKREYVGAELGANNPIHEVIIEAYSLFGGSARVLSLLSIGTGNPGVVSLPSSDEDLHTTMREMLNDCEQKAQDVERRIGRLGIYSRFSVEQGMQKRQPSQTADPGWITAQTETYLAHHETCEKLEIFVQNVGGKVGPISLDQLRMFLSRPFVNLTF